VGGEGWWWWGGCRGGRGGNRGVGTDGGPRFVKVERASVGTHQRQTTSIYSCSGTRRRSSLQARKVMPNEPAVQATTRVNKNERPTATRHRPPSRRRRPRQSPPHIHMPLSFPPPSLLNRRAGTGGTSARAARGNPEMTISPCYSTKPKASFVFVNDRMLPRGSASARPQARADYARRHDIQLQGLSLPRGVNKPRWRALADCHYMQSHFNGSPLMTQATTPFGLKNFLGGKQAQAISGVAWPHAGGAAGSNRVRRHHMRDRPSYRRTGALAASSAPP